MTPSVEPSSTISPAAGSRGGLLAFTFSLAISLLIVAPFFWRGVASGHDFEFHATSWLDVASQWKQGIFYPRWMDSANHGFGEPRFIFYPPLSWMLAPALSFFIPWDYVPATFIVLVQTFAGLSAFVFARRLLPERAAFFAAVCYAANPNALLMIYYRSDYAELLACAFFPLLFLAALQVAGIIEGVQSRQIPKVAFFGATFAAVWLSNAPAGVLAAYSVTSLFLWTALAQRRAQPLTRGALGVVLGFGLAAFYIVPAAYQQRWVNIAQALSPGLLPSENFLYSVTNDPEHTFFNYIASTIAVALIAFTGCAAIAARRATPDLSQDAALPRLWRVFLLLAVIPTVLMLRPAGIFWQILPKLRFVQFPWRWMSILNVPFIYFLGVAATRRRARWLWLAAVATLLLGTAVFLIQHTWWDDEDIATLRAAMASGEGFDGADEYDPIGDDHYNLPKDAPRVHLLPTGEDISAFAPQLGTQARVIYERWTAERKELRIDSSKPVRVELRLLDYPAWRVQVNGARVVPEHAEDSAQIIVSVPAGQSRITARFTRTPDRTLGGSISAASVVLLFVLYGIPRRKTAAETKTG
jgi:hypothetical protein